MLTANADLRKQANAFFSSRGTGRSSSQHCSLAKASHSANRRTDRRSLLNPSLRSLGVDRVAVAAGCLLPSASPHRALAALARWMDYGGMPLGMGYL